MLHMIKLSRITDYVIICSGILSLKPILNNYKITVIDRFN